jgi:hypothetical protein
MEGYKEDGGKIRTDLLPVEPLMEIAKVLTMGAKKYPERNWEDGMDWHRPYGAILRHLFAWWKGEDLDESGLSHLAHAGCEVLFLLEYHLKQKGNDNRPKVKI